MADADVVGGVDGAVNLDDLARGRRQRRAPAGTAPLARSRARSLASSREGRDLIRCPPVSTWTRRVSAQILMRRPVIAGPSQICCPATYRLSDGGTTRSSSTAQLAGGWCQLRPLCL